MGEFVIPDLLGGTNTLMIGKVLWTEFFYNRDWPVASAVAIILLALLVVPIMLYQRAQEKAHLMKRFSNFNIFALVVGFSFLYIPIILLILFSFNESRLVTVWGGFSTKWYVELMQNQGIKDAAWVTIKVAFISSTVATALGTIAGLVMTRFWKL